MPKYATMVCITNFVVANYLQLAIVTITVSPNSDAYFLETKCVHSKSTGNRETE